MTSIAPRYRMGFIAPPATGVEARLRIQPEPLLPPDVVQVSTGLGIKDYTPEGVDEAMGRYWDCVNELVQQGAQSIHLGGVPISSQLGRDRVLRTIEETQQKTGLPADATNETIIAAFKRLGVDQIAVASRWAAQLNQALVDYFAQGGIRVASITSEGQWAREAFAMSIERGIVLAVRLGRDAMRQAPSARGLLLPGGTWRSLTAVPLLEEDFDVPVLTNTTALTWKLISAGIAPPVQGWGRLLANP